MGRRRNQQTAYCNRFGTAVRGEDGSLTLNHPRDERLDPGGPLEIHRKFGESKLVVLGLKFRRHSPQPTRDREIEGGSGSPCQRRYAPLTTAANP
jgi:hypothetical protein